MHVLKDILYKVSLLSTKGDMELPVREIHFDSRSVKSGDLFVAIRGTQTDGHNYIAKAIAQGCVAIVCEQMPEELEESVTYVQVTDSSKALAWISANYYGHPSRQLKLVAVTGTNGKTTMVTLLHQLYREMGYMAGMLSTVENRINDQVVPSTHTTPDALSINRLLVEMVAAGCSYCFMEASSHAIVQERIAGLHFRGAIFTNISRDHLDYHETFNAYIKAKKKLFDELPSGAFALVNADDKRGMVMVQNTQASIYTYALKYPGDFKAKIISNTLHGMELYIDNQSVWFRMIGEFNAYNLLGVLGTAVILGEEPNEVLMQLSQLRGASGRFEQVILHGITAIIDYAHTPDALENVLKTIENLRTGGEKLITVVGCGGNRDKGKRPIMAKIACQHSDKTIFTSDNPRDEDPGQIIREMEAGINPVDLRKILSIADRREAIKTACLIAQKGDIILIAGKGHETYQEIKGVKYPFDDKKTVTELLKITHSA